MEREILFRGKRIDNGKWVYGSLFVTRKGEYKIKWYDPHYGSSKTSKVDPVTVGEYIGITDKNGKRIFEGDVIIARYLDDGRLTQGVVNFLNGCFCVKNDDYDNPPINMLNEYEIVGNIHDKEDELHG